MDDLIDVFNEDDTRRGRMLVAVGHRMPWAIGVIAALEVPYYLQAENPLFGLVQLATVVPVLIGIFHISFARLCIRCLSQIPRDGAQRAVRHGWLLRLYHRQLGLKAWLILLVVMAATPVVLAAVGLPRWLGVPVDVYWYAWLMSLWVHHRLRLWCPGCDDGDGGWIEEPSPDPSRVHVR